VTTLFQILATAAVYGLSLWGFWWLFRFLYGFFQPLDRLIDEDRVFEFGIAGLAFGTMVASVIIWWASHLA